MSVPVTTAKTVLWACLATIAGCGALLAVALTYRALTWLGWAGL